MDVDISEAYAVACQALGEAVVRERIITGEVQRLTVENAALKASAPPVPEQH